MHERQLIRSDLYVADELSCAEPPPRSRLSARSTTTRSAPGPVTKAIQDVFFEAVRGRDERFSRWLEYAEKTPATPGS